MIVTLVTLEGRTDKRIDKRNRKTRREGKYLTTADLESMKLRWNVLSDGVDETMKKLVMEMRETEISEEKGDISTKRDRKTSRACEGEKKHWR